MRYLGAVLLWAGLMSAAAQAELLWDNYPSGYDLDATPMSSERDTLVSSSWSVDDMSTDVPVIPDGIEWVGQRTLGVSFPGADVLILDSDFQVVAELTDVEYSSTQLVDKGDREVYEGRAELSDLELPAGQYYVGVRLVGGDDLGRHFIVPSMGGVRGVGSGLFRSPLFGITDWTNTEDLASISEPMDFSLRITGVRVPEPAAGLLMLVAPLLAGRRR